jgi:hypothetical protein
MKIDPSKSGETDWRLDASQVKVARFGEVVAVELADYLDIEMSRQEARDLGRALLRAADAELYARLVKDE